MKTKSDGNVRQNHLLWPHLYCNVIRVSNVVYSNISCILAVIVSLTLQASLSQTGAIRPSVELRFGILTWVSGMFKE